MHKTIINHKLLCILFCFVQWFSWNKTIWYNYILICKLGLLNASKTKLKTIKLDQAV